MTEDEKKQLEELAVKEIKTIFDPEIPVNIYDLGLIYDVQATEEKEIVVLMTLTAPACPVADSLPNEVETKIKNIDGVKNAKVMLTFDPPWDKSFMSDEAKLQLNMF